MTGALAAGGVAIAVGDLWLVARCWRHRSVLGGVLGAGGILLVVFAIGSGPTAGPSEGALVIALVLLIIGACLYWLGQTLERLLREPPDEEARGHAHKESAAKTTNKFMHAATGVGAALALSACGTSGGNATTHALPRPHAAPVKVSSDSSLRAATRRVGRVITVRSSKYGAILADRGDRTIYLFTRDLSASSNCYGRCAAVWPPVLTRGAPRRAGGLPGALGTTRRRGGARQVTYDGHPLYYYTGDVSPGQILCQNVDEFGGTWLVVSPTGKPVR